MSDRTGGISSHEIHVACSHSCFFSDSEPEPEPELKPPTNLVTSEVTHRSFRATWTAADGPVEQYRIVYTLASGGPSEEAICCFTLLY